MNQFSPGEFVLDVYQEFYVGHSYNSLQIIIGAYHLEQGTLIFYGNRTSTDKVACIAGSLKRNIGREVMRKTVIEHYESIRRLVQ